MGIVLFIIFCLMFIFSCMKSILPIGGIIVGTFGICTYPLLLLCMLFSLAKILGLKYTRNKKTTIYFCIILFSLLGTIQAISTFRELNLVVNFKSLKTYLKLSYSKVTLVGSFGSILCGLLSIFLGAMGVIIIDVILSTLFIGILVDYNYYGKYDDATKKLKNKKLREKVSRSDENITNGMPAYSYSDSENEVVGEIVATDDDLRVNEGHYSEGDVVEEIISPAPESGYETNLNAYDETTYNTQIVQTKNEFDDEFVSRSQVPNIYEEDPYEQRRKFLRDTLGTSEETHTNDLWGSSSNENVADNVSDFESQLNSLTSGQTDLSNTSKSSGFDISDLPNLRFSEDELDTQNDYNTIFGQGISEPQNSAVKDIPAFEPQMPKSEPNNLSTFGNNNVSSGNFSQPTFGNNSFNQIQKPTQNQTNFVSQQPVMQSPSPNNINIAMPGVRYNPPPLSLLRVPKPDTGDYTEEQNRKSVQLENVLSAFNVKATVKNIVRGPKITRYELSVPLGTSVNKIPTYEKDIAAALAAKTIVIKAPIPGSSYVGIELENDSFTSVYERELLESAEFQNAKDPLPIAIGKDISGEIVVKSLTKMVHVLIAGSTGSGKSVFIHNIVLSLIYKYGPEDLRLIMIDPKRVEFNRYNGLPHLLTTEVVMGSEKAINALKWCVKEMDRRYDLMNKAGYNNIEPYNKSELVKAHQFEHMPYIVIIVDELAEIMIANKKESEVCIQRITQLARACGMHLIVATQRPSVDIISGVIKNNIPSRIAFSLQSSIDSKTILNTVGAEKLLGQGDMIFSPTGTQTMPRLQAAYASDDEIQAVIDYDKKYNQANYDERVESSFNAEQAPADELTGAGGDTTQKNSVDEYFKKAVQLVMLNGGASTSYLQRRLSIGYARAARIVDQMEDKGYIAPSTGSKLKKILITPEQFKEEFGEDYDSVNE